MPRYRLNYVDEDDVCHPLGDSVEAPDGDTAKTVLMDLYWDDRLDAASCTPIVTLVRPDDHINCDDSPCEYEIDRSKEPKT
jgi:hypothetical protein